MKNLPKLFKQNIHLFVILVGAIVANICGVAWWVFALSALGYVLLIFLLTYKTSSAKAYYMLDTIFRFDKAKAKRAYKKFFSRQTKCGEALVTYGIYLLEDCEFDEAKTVFDYLINLKNLSPQILKYARQDYSIAQWKTGDIDGAIETMRKMLDDYEVFPDTFNITLGYYYIVKGDYEQALLFTNKVLDNTPDHGPAYDNLGQIAFAQGDLKKAEEYFHQALQYRPSMADSKYYLGLIAEEVGDTESAAIFFNACAESKINGMNTVTREMVAEKAKKYPLDSSAK